MTKSSQQLQVPQEELAALTPSNSLGIFKVAAAALFVCALALAPAAAFAQHGGGGGGGSHGGGGGGGAHGGIGSGGGASAPMSSGGGGAHATGGSSGGSHPANSASGSSSGGHSWNPFHGNSSAAKPAPANGANSMPAGNIKSEGSATNAPSHFAAGNNTWVEPPKTAASTAGKVNYYGPANVNASRPYVPLSTTTRGAATTAHGAAVVSAQHPYQPIGPGYNYYPYYPYPYFGYNPFYGGLGFGWGGFGPCNPFWGCGGYGNGFGFGFGYGYGYGGGFGSIGGSYPSNYNSGWTDESAEDSESKTSPDDPSSYTISANPSAKAPDTAASNELSDLPPVNADQPTTYVLLFLKDGSNFAVSDYWLSGGKLHYVTSYGGENAIDEAQLDLQRTVNENAPRGVTFSLRPQPAGTTDAPAAAPAAEPERLPK